MAKDKFLDELKKSLDSGEFNSKIAQKINDINELADKKSEEIGSKKTGDARKDASLLVNEMSDAVSNRIEDSGVRVGDEEMAEEAKKKEKEILTDYETIDKLGRDYVTLIDRYERIIQDVKVIDVKLKAIDETLEDCSEIVNKDPLTVEIRKTIGNIKEDISQLLEKKSE